MKHLNGWLVAQCRSALVCAVSVNPLIHSLIQAPEFELQSDNGASWDYALPKHCAKTKSDDCNQ